MNFALAHFTPGPDPEFHQPHTAIYFAADCPESTPEECAREDAHRYGMAVEIQDAVPVLAAKFRAVLTEWLGADKVAEIIRINRAPDTHPNACASGDFCDSNVAMLEAWQAVIPEEFDFHSDVHSALWDSAWAIFRHSIS